MSGSLGSLSWGDLNGKEVNRPPPKKVQTSKKIALTFAYIR